MRYQAVLSVCLLVVVCLLVGAARAITPYTITDLGTLGGGEYSYSTAEGINDSGQVVGHAWSGSEVIHAFLWENGVMQDLGTLYGGYSTAEGINDSGQVVGESDFPTGCTAFLWENGTMQDLGTLPDGFGSGARSVNDSGQVVGCAMTAAWDWHAFLWENSVMQDLGTLGGTSSDAYGINGSGQVVGKAKTANEDGHACLWENGAMYDLNELILSDSGWALRRATCINDVGQVVGTGLNPQGYEHAFLLTPIPEPSTPSLVVLGALGLLLRRRR